MVGYIMKKIKIYMIFIILLFILAFIYFLLLPSQRTMKVGIHPWIGYETIYLADKFGWFEQKVQLIDNLDAQNSLIELQQHKIDAAAITLDEAIRGCSMGIDLEIVAILDISVGADVVLAKPDINISKIKESRIAFEHNALGELMFQEFLKKYSLKNEEVETLKASPFQQIQAFEKNQADIFITYEPYASELKKNGLVEIFSSKDMSELIVDVLVVKKDIMPEVRSALKLLIAGHFKSLSYLERNRDDALYRIAGFRNISVSKVKKALSGIRIPTLTNNQKMLSPGSQLIEATDKLYHLMQEKKLLQSTQTCKHLFNTTFLPDEYEF